VWLGPGIPLPAGGYTVTLSLRVLPLPGFPVPNASAPVLWVGAVGFAQPTFFGTTYPFGALDSRSFETVSFSVVLPAPTLEFAIQGVLLDSFAQVTLNYLEVAPQ
jgi:hypothetical protein